jgi:hypothetical protein
MRIFQLFKGMLNNECIKTRDMNLLVAFRQIASNLVRRKTRASPMAAFGKRELLPNVCTTGGIGWIGLGSMETTKQIK